MFKPSPLLQNSLRPLAILIRHQLYSSSNENGRYKCDIHKRAKQAGDTHWFIYFQFST